MPTEGPAKGECEMDPNGRNRSVPAYRRNAAGGRADESARKQRRVDEREEESSAWINYWQLLGWTGRGRGGGWYLRGAQPRRGE